MRSNCGPVAVRKFAKFPPIVETEELTGSPGLLLPLASPLTLKHCAGEETALGFGTAGVEEVVVAAAFEFLEKLCFRLMG